MGFATLDDLREYLGIPDGATKDDARLGVILEAANCAVLQWLCLDACEPTQYVLTADIDCYDRCVDTLWSQVRPIISVDQVLNGGRVVRPERIRCRADRIRLSCEAWSCGCTCDGSPNAEVTVTAGFLPDDPALKAIAMGVMDLAAMSYKGGGKGIKSEKVGRYSITYETGGVGSVPGLLGWPISLQGALHPYVQIIYGDLLTRKA